MNNDTIPFGKYRGRKISELQILDRGYLDWLIDQPGFRQRNPTLHEAIINALNAVPVETPEHNQRQIRFLDQEFVWRVLDAAGLGWDHTWHLDVRFEVNNIDVTVAASQIIHDVHKDYEGNEHHHDFHQHQDSALIEIKPSLGDDYPAVLRQIMDLAHQHQRDQYGNNQQPFVRCKRVLLVGTFTSEVTNRDQLRAFMHTRNVHVVFEADV